MYCPSGRAGVGFVGAVRPTSEPFGSSNVAKRCSYRSVQSSRISPNCTRSVNSAARVSGTPIGAALVSATIATSADGIAVNAVAAPSANAPEWLSVTRPAGLVPTLNPYP